MPNIPSNKPIIQINFEGADGFIIYNLVKNQLNVGIFYEKIPLNDIILIYIKLIRHIVIL